MNLPCQIPSDAEECIEFSQVCLERDFHKATSAMLNLRRKLRKYVKSNTDELPECIDMYDSGRYTADDLKDILLGCIDEFEFIFSELDKVAEHMTELRDDFGEYVIEF